MYIHVTEEKFVEEFHKCNRENKFSARGRIALFEYLEEIEEETGIDIYLDIVELCCSWSEYEDKEDFIYQNAYPAKYNSDEVRNMNDDEFFEMMEEYTQVIQLGDTSDDGFLVQAF